MSKQKRTGQILKGRLKLPATATPTTDDLPLSCQEPQEIYEQAGATMWRVALTAPRAPQPTPPCTLAQDVEKSDNSITRPPPHKPSLSRTTTTPPRPEVRCIPHRCTRCWKTLVQRSLVKERL
ncbi:hypothetical protein E2C01_011425 [Portunus trituberculatus]|uniref:Uncharacterized protein n=1 Tax=Portunus trituberculatus TaxID=210409 RepID=A0A5B7DAZ9_PORTR|nr:hypothetical protein [Portunus trituberculatus]